MISPVSIAVPPGPVALKDEVANFFTNKELLPLLRQMRTRLNSAFAAESVAELRLTSPRYVDDIVPLLGYTTEGDGAEGWFRWDDDSVRADNGGTVFAVAGITTGRWIRIFRGPVNLKWFGADGDGVIDTSAAVQAWINAAGPEAMGAYAPAGGYVCATSIDLTASGTIRIYGEGNRSQFIGTCTGQPVFTLTGAVDIRMQDIRITGSQAHPPSCAILASRGASSGSAGVHRFLDVETDGYFTAAGYLGLASESNSHISCRYQNNADGGWACAVLGKNDLGVTTPYGAFPGVFAGGNTDHAFTNCKFEGNGTGGTGGALLVSGVRGLTVTAPFFGTVSGSPEAGVKFDYEDSDGVVMTGITGELSTATHGLMIAAGRTLSVSSFSGITGDTAGSWYGAAGSIVQRCHFLGSYIAGSGAYDFDTVENCWFHMSPIGWAARTAAHGNWFAGSAAGATTFTFPAASAGNVWAESTLRSDGHLMYRTHIGDQTDNERVEMKQARAYLWQTFQQDMSTTGATITPAIRSGGTLLITATQNFTLNIPNDLASSGASTQFDIGCSFEVVVIQANGGGWLMTLGAGYTAVGAGITALSAAVGAYTRYRVVFLTSGVFLISDG